MLTSEIFCILVVLFHITIGSNAQTVYSCDTTAACGCSTNSAVLSRIVGGEAANTETWGWAVSILIAGGYLCGGSIVSSSWILTAAHCVNGIEASQVTIYAGSTFRWTGSQTSVASKVVVHSEYNSHTYENDIALLKLETPLIMSDAAVSTICLPSVNATTLTAGEWPPAGTTVVAVGWGTLSEGGSLPSTLQQVTLQTISYQASSCNSSIADWHTQLCAGVSGGGKDTCQGDSGGPLMMFSSSRQWVLVGLTSNGIGCAQANYAGVYTRVAAFMSWISTNTNGAISTLSSSTSTTVSTSTTRTTTTTVFTSTTRTTTTTTNSGSTTTIRSATTISSITTTRSTTVTSSSTSTRSTSTSTQSTIIAERISTTLPGITSGVSSATRHRPIFLFFSYLLPGSLCVRALIK